jgi:hypothetical protein
MAAGWYRDRVRLKEDADRAEQLAEQQAEMAALYALAGPRVGPRRFEVAGLVCDTLPTERMVQIDLGLDDALRRGDVLDVMRRQDALPHFVSIGRIRLFAVDKASAAGTVVDEKTAIQKGDFVALPSRTP